MAGTDAPLQPGEVVVIGASASVQFSGRHGFKFRVIHVDSRPTYDGWCGWTVISLMGAARRQHAVKFSSGGRA
jgi:hypothetical protein